MYQDTIKHTKTYLNLEEEKKKKTIKKKMVKLYQKKQNSTKVLRIITDG